ncbi:acyl-CoA esterase [Pasteurellaceae bacterium RH1A]|nr:acyl-CoA esterase [Pasteurellaceae bacterium RH1A]
MQETMLLNYQFQKSSQASKGCLVFIHGLFGDMNNLGVIARAFAEDYDILRLDLRNHGRSFHSPQMNYELMAQDVQAVLKTLNLAKCTVIGHSMGGKTAMKLADIAPDLIEQLIVIDIAPIAYPLNRHNTFFAGLFAVKAAGSTSRQAAKEVMAEHITDEGVQQFMLKAFDPESPDRFRFNLSGLKDQYAHLMDWQPVKVELPTLFIKGALSDYIQEKDTASILAQFPQAKSFVVSNADHWVHAEKPDAVVRAIQRVLTP